MSKVTEGSSQATNRTGSSFAEDSGLVKEEWSIPFDDLTLENSIGEGSFGKVMKGDYFGTKVAVKKLFNHDDKKMQKYIQRELATLKNIRHPNVVQFMGLSIHTSGVYLVTEFVAGGDLTVYIDDLKIPFTWKMISKVALQVAQAMAYLHAKNIVHRDMKCSNLLIGDNWTVKVCDFGMARKASKKLTQMTICGTDEYMAPEVILGSDYNAQADVFSYGLCLYEVITRQVPAQREFKNRYAFDVQEFQRSLPQQCPQGFYQLVVDCCNYDPTKRPTFKQIIDRLNKEEVKDEPVKYNWKMPEERKPTNRPKTVQMELLVQELDNMELNNLPEAPKANEPPKESPKAEETKEPAKPQPVSTIQQSTPAQSTQPTNSSNPPAKETQKWDAARRHTTAIPRAPTNQVHAEGRRNTIGASREAPTSDMIHDIISSGNLQTLVQLLTEVPNVNLDAPNRNDETPLFAAVKYSRAEMVEELLKRKLTSVNTPNKEGVYPIHLACKNSNVKIAKLLLEAQAKLKVLDRAKNYPIHIACELGNVELVSLILEKGGITLLEISNENGETPLLLCCRCGYDPIVAVLIKAGANIRISDKHKRSPLWYAAKLGNNNLCKLLLDAKCETEMVSDDGTTPFVQAAKENRLETAILLVRNGVDISKYREHSLGPTAEFRQAILEAAGRPTSSSISGGTAPLAPTSPAKQ